MPARRRAPFEREQSIMPREALDGDAVPQAAPPLRVVGEEVAPRAIHAHLTRPVLRLLGTAGAHTILDLGCGSGWLASALDRCGFRVTGGDRDETALQRARRHRPEMEFVQLDVELPPHPALLRRFDAVVAIDLLDHLPRPGAAIATALAALKPGGLFIASVPHHGYAKNLVLAVGGRLDARWEAAVDGGRLKHFSRETLHALLRDRGLQTVQVQPIGRVPMFARAMLAAGRAPG